MTQKLLSIAAAVLVAISVMGGSAHAQSGCYADYKAKRSSGGSLELHYGVIQLGQNACNNATRRQRAVAQRIGADGWTLLRVLSTFDQNGLSQRQGNAGQYFLRY